MNKEPAVIIGAVQAAVVAVYALLRVTGVLDFGDIQGYVDAVGTAVLALVSAVFVRSMVTPTAKLTEVPGAVTPVYGNGKAA